MLARKGNGKEAKLSYSGHVLMENRHGMVADVEVLPANGTAERDAALVMIEAIPGDHQVTVGADKGYDTKDFVSEARNLNATPKGPKRFHHPSFGGRHLPLIYGLQEVGLDYSP